MTACRLTLLAEQDNESPRFSPPRGRLARFLQMAERHEKLCKSPAGPQAVTAGAATPRAAVTPGIGGFG